MQETIKENEFKLPFFQANHEVISFVPDPTHPKPNLPDPGVDSALTVKLTLADGLGHKLFKRVEKEREAWVRKWRDSECLRESHSLAMSDNSGVHTERPSSSRHVINDSCHAYDIHTGCCIIMNSCLSRSARVPPCPIAIFNHTHKLCN